MEMCSFLGGHPVDGRKFKIVIAAPKSTKMSLEHGKIYDKNHRKKIVSSCLAPEKLNPN